MRFFVIFLLLQIQPVWAQQPIDTRFNYQGVLSDAGQPADGFYDFQLDLFDNPIISVPLETLTFEAVEVVGGRFVLTPDFGDQFQGEARYLGIRARRSGDDEFTSLDPRQELTAVPYALYAENVGVGAVGTAQLQVGAVDNSALGEGVVTADKLGTGAVTLAKIASDAVDSRRIRDRAVGEAELAEGAVTNDKLATASVSAAKIQTGAVTSLAIADGTVGNGDIATNAISSGKILDNSIRDVDIADGNVRSAEIDDDAVQSRHLEPGAVGSEAIADGAISADDLSPASGLYFSNSRFIQSPSQTQARLDAARSPLSVSTREIYSYLERAVAAIPTPMSLPNQRQP